MNPRGNPYSNHHSVAPDLTRAGYQRIRIHYSNDKHEKYDAMPHLIDAFQRKTREAKQQNIPCLNVDAGDWNIGTEADQIALDVRLHNLMQMDVVALGNHDFDAGSKALSDALKLAKFTTFCNNLNIPKNSDLYKRYLDGQLEAYYRVFNFPTGLKLGVIGITVPNMKTLMNPNSNMQGVHSLSGDQTLQRLQKFVDEMRYQMGINKILLVSHAGFPFDSKKIAQKVSGIDIIVGGHSHTTIDGLKEGYNVLKAPNGEPIVIVSTGKDGKAFGVLDAMFDPWGRIIPTENTLYNPRTFPRHKGAETTIDQALGQQTVIGYISKFIDTDEAQFEGENGVANKIADAMRLSTHSDIAFFKGNELRNSLYPGKFSDRDLDILLPFADNMVKVNMTGMEIVKALQNSGRCIRDEDNHPSMLHPSGLEYVVDKQNGKLLRVNVMNTKTNAWEPLQKDKTYSVAVSAFLVNNRHEYPMFKPESVTQRFAFNAKDALGVVMRKMAVHGPLTFPTDGRVLILNDDIRKHHDEKPGVAFKPSPQGNPFARVG